MDELDAQFQDELQDELRNVLNREIFDRLFKIDDDNKTEVRISRLIYRISLFSDDISRLARSHKWPILSQEEIDALLSATDGDEARLAIWAAC